MFVVTPQLRIPLEELRFTFRGVRAGGAEREQGEHQGAVALGRGVQPQSA